MKLNLTNINIINKVINKWFPVILKPDNTMMDIKEIFNSGNTHAIVSFDNDLTVESFDTTFCVYDLLPSPSKCRAQYNLQGNNPGKD